MSRVPHPTTSDELEDGELNESQQRRHSLETEDKSLKKHKKEKKAKKEKKRKKEKKHKKERQIPGRTDHGDGVSASEALGKEESLKKPSSSSKNENHGDVSPSFTITIGGTGKTEIGQKEKAVEKPPTIDAEKPTKQHEAMKPAHDGGDKDPVRPDSTSRRDSDSKHKNPDKPWVFEYFSSHRRLGKINDFIQVPRGAAGLKAETRSLAMRATRILRENRRRVVGVEAWNGVDRGIVRETARGQLSGNEVQNAVGLLIGQRRSRSGGRLRLIPVTEVSNADGEADLAFKQGIEAVIDTMTKILSAKLTTTRTKFRRKIEELRKKRQKLIEQVSDKKMSIYEQADLMKNSALATSRDVTTSIDAMKLRENSANVRPDAPKSDDDDDDEEDERARLLREAKALIGESGRSTSQDGSRASSMSPRQDKKMVHLRGRDATSIDDDLKRARMEELEEEKRLQIDSAEEKRKKLLKEAEERKKKKEENSFDMFADDAAIPLDNVGAAIITSHGDPKNNALKDNWDDTDGYYRVRIGEVMNGCYRHF
ncbi:unnamed protein product, partial [Mesorhabditis spiculigera]